MTPWQMRECAVPGCDTDALPGDEFCVRHIYEVIAQAERMWTGLSAWLAKVKA